MSAISASLDQLQVTIERLMAPIGGYSLEKHFLIAVIGALLLVSGPALIGLLRGTDRTITQAAQRDVLIGIGCLLPIVTFLGFFFFVGRGYVTALFAQSE